MVEALGATEEERSGSRCGTGRACQDSAGGHQQPHCGGDQRSGLVQTRRTASHRRGHRRRRLWRLHDSPLQIATAALTIARLVWQMFIRPMYLYNYYDNLILYLWAIVIGCVSSEQTGGNRAEENTFKSLMVPAAQSSSHGGKLREDVIESLDGDHWNKFEIKAASVGPLILHRTRSRWF